jgi:hypothetical protein
MSEARPTARETLDAVWHVLSAELAFHRRVAGHASLTAAGLCRAMDVVQQMRRGEYWPPSDPLEREAMAAFDKVTR